MKLIQFSKIILSRNRNHSKVNRKKVKIVPKKKRNFTYKNQSEDSLSISKESSNKNLSKENSEPEKETTLDEDDLKLKDTIKAVKYEHYVGDNRFIGSLFEEDIINYVYDKYFELFFIN